MVGSCLDVVGESVRAQAIDLSPWGVLEHAFRSEDAIEAVNEITAAGIAVLGGDLWKQFHARPRPAHENWHVERHPGEQWQGYVARSQQTALAFIQEHGTKQEVIFVLVCADEKTYSNFV